MDFEHTNNKSNKLIVSDATGGGAVSLPCDELRVAAPTVEEQEKAVSGIGIGLRTTPVVAFCTAIAQ